MLLHELREPSVHKYGGSLTREEEDRCVRTTQLSPRWAPYPYRKVEVEHVSGRFENFHGEAGWRGMDERLGAVCFKIATPFGNQTEMFHVRGQASLKSEQSDPIPHTLFIPFLIPL